VWEGVVGEVKVTAVGVGGRKRGERDPRAAQNVPVAAARSKPFVAADPKFVYGGLFSRYQNRQRADEFYSISRQLSFQIRLL